MYVCLYVCIYYIDIAFLKFIPNWPYLEDY